MTNAEINKAIVTVMVNQYKRDAVEAHKIVKEAGYEIYKTNGSFGVQKGYRHQVRIEFPNRGGNPYLQLFNGRSSRVIRFKNFSDIKVDFVSFFDTDREPIFDTSSYWYETPTQKKIKDIENKKWRVEYRSKDIEEIKQKMERLQRELIDAVESKERAKAELAEARRQYGLKV